MDSILLNVSALSLDSGYWVGIGALINLLYTLATIFIVVINFLYLKYFIRLQTGLNQFYLDQDQRSHSNNIAQLKRSRIVALSEEWNSESMVRARIQANMHFKQNHPSERIEQTEENLQLLTSISRIAHFFERLELLVSSDQIDLGLASKEYRSIARYWFRRLRYIYKKDSSEERLHDLWVKLLSDFGWSEEEILETTLQGEPNKSSFESSVTPATS